MIPYHRPIKIEEDVWPMLSNGPYVRQVEEWFKGYYDVEHAIACSSCTMGLLITSNFTSMFYYPAFTWSSTQWALFHSINNGAKALDIDPHSWLVDEVSLPMMSVHTFGSVSEISHGMCVYDGAHALGSRLRDIGIATVISLAPTKMITAGEGGIILTNVDGLAEAYRLERDRYGRMSEFNARYFLQTVGYLDEVLDFKKRCYHYYKNHLDGQFQEIPIHSNYNTIGMLTDLKIPDDIEVRKYYEPLVTGFPNTDHVYKKIICLPSWYGVDHEKIVERIKEHNENIDHGIEGLHRFETKTNDPV